MAFVQLAEGELHYQLDGPVDAPVLVLSNSLGTRLEMWDAQMATLIPHFRVLRYDSRGHGRSATPAVEASIERLGRDALAVLDAVEADKAHFCGVSLGGMVGQWVGVNAPQRIDRLVLANTAAWLGPAQNWQARIDDVLDRGMSSIANTVIEHWFTPEFRATRPEVAARMHDMILHTDARGYTSCCAAIRDMDQRGSVAHIAARTLVIGGEFDPATPLEKSRELTRAIPSAELIVLPAAHLSNIEQATPFNHAVLKFLERH